uniref:Uncharacterized protein n=1 Tax=Glossina pallidipes TaxID=7398 RepID=A0A1A9ZAZ2_GLOPL
MQLNYNKSYLCYKIATVRRLMRYSENLVDNVHGCGEEKLSFDSYFEFGARISKSLRFRLPTTIGPALDTVPSCNNRGLLTRAAAMPKTAALANGMRKLLAKSALCDNSDRFFDAIDFCAIGKVIQFKGPYEQPKENAA